MTFPEALDFARNGLSWWTSLLIVVIYLAYSMSVFIPKSVNGGHRWVPVGPVFTFALSGVTAYLFFLQLEPLAALIGRLAQFVDVAHDLVMLYATAFILGVIIVTVRGYFVISEMDSGRYGGSGELPVGLAESSTTARVVEWIVRLVIILALSLFISIFLRVVIPTNVADTRITGTPMVIAELQRACADYVARVQSVGFGQGESECLAERISSLSLEQHGNGQAGNPTLPELVRRLTDPLRWLFVVYFGMMAWCLIMLMAGPLQKSAQRKRYELALWLQILIPLTAAINVALMLWWVDTSIRRQTPFLPGADVSSALMVVAFIGIGLSALVLLLVSCRLPADCRTLLNLWALLRAPKPL